MGISHFLATRAIHQQVPDHTHCHTHFLTIAAARCAWLHVPSYHQQACTEMKTTTTTTTSAQIYPLNMFPGLLIPSKPTPWSPDPVQTYPNMLPGPLTPSKPTLWTCSSLTGETVYQWKSSQHTARSHSELRGPRHRTGPPATWSAWAPWGAAGREAVGTLSRGGVHRVGMAPKPLSFYNWEQRSRKNMLSI